MFRKLQRQLDRRTAGRGSSKFIFDTTVTSLDGIPPHVKFCQIAWTRGAKEQRTEVVPVQKGLAVWKQKLSQSATLYKDTQKAGAWEAKECFFKVLVSSLSTPGEFSTACKLPLDLAAYASPEHSEDHISLQVSFATKQSGKGQPFGQLRLQFSSHLPTTQGTGDNTSVTDSASSAGLSSDRHEQDLAGFETTQDLTSTGQSQSSSVSPLPPNAQAKARAAAELANAHEEILQLRSQMASVSEAAKQSEKGNAELQQRLEAMAQLQQETIRAYAGDSVYDGESHADSNGGPRNTPSGASSRNTAQEKSRRSSLLKRVAQLEAANQELTRTLEQQRREVQVTPGDSVRLREVQMEIQLAEEHIAELEDKLSAANAQGFAPGTEKEQAQQQTASSMQSLIDRQVELDAKTAECSDLAEQLKQAQERAAAQTRITAEAQAKVEELEAELKVLQEKREKERAKADQRRQEGLQAVEEAAMMAEQAQTERDEAQQALQQLSAELQTFTGRLLQHKQQKSKSPEVDLLCDRHFATGGKPAPFLDSDSDHSSSGSFGDYRTIAASSHQQASPDSPSSSPVVLNLTKVVRELEQDKAKLELAVRQAVLELSEAKEASQGTSAAGQQNNGDVSRLSQQTESARAETDDALAENDRLRGEIEGLQRKQHQLELRAYDDSSLDVEELRQQLDEACGTIANLQDENDHLMGLIPELEERIKSTEVQAIAGLQTAEGQQDFRREMQRLQHELHQEQENRASMQSQMEGMETELDELRGDLLHARQSAVDLESALHDSHTKRTQMQIEKHMMEQQIQETTSDLIEAERELSISQTNSPAPSSLSRNSSKRDLDDAVIIEKLRREHDWMMQELVLKKTQMAENAAQSMELQNEMHKLKEVNGELEYRLAEQAAIAAKIYTKTTAKGKRK
ncbi:hypothetical protein WJX84_000883 [Apatococcus fuscideae]|uniref:C2 NT-type domain-containing protein n=1 Tax=Apatococcus fuscideae TaxID=2026836 RepID=A0AAW1TBT3_9CHLO